MCTKRRRQKKSKDYGTPSPANQQLHGKTKQERKDRQGSRRGEPRERGRERETTPSNANPKQPNLRNENPNRCSCGYEQVLGRLFGFYLRTAGSGSLRRYFLIILVLKMRTRFPSVILLTNLDQNLLVVNLQLNLWLTSILVTFFFFFPPKTSFSVLVPIPTHK